MISRRMIFLIVSIIFLGVIGLISYSLIPKSYIVFKTAPDQVVIMIDGKDKRVVNNGDSITVAPGRHNIVVFRDEFNPFTTDITLNNGASTEIVSSLIALTNDAKYIINSGNSTYVIEKATSIKMDKDVEITTAMNPIMNVLPINGVNYNISSCASELYPNNPNKIALCVDIQSDEYKDVVKDDIKSRGYNPDNYEYIWNNYLNGV